MPELDTSSGEKFHIEQGVVLPTPGSTLSNGLDLEGHGCISWLPEQLTIHGALRLRGTQLMLLPAFLSVYGDVELEGVETLTELGEHIFVEGDLDLEGCANLLRLPDYLTVSGDLFLAGTGVRIVPITNRIAGNVYDLT